MRGEEKMDAVGQDDEGVEEVVALGAVVLEGGEEEFAVGWHLEDAAGVLGAACDEESAGSGGTARDRHGGIYGMVGLLGMGAG